MDKKVFQELFDKILPYLPEKWKALTFFAGYTEGSYSMNFYVRNSEDEYCDCFQLSTITRACIVKLFADINKVLVKERENMEKRDKWTILTMMVDSDGNMKTEFDYRNHAEDMIRCENEWKKKFYMI